MFQTSWRARGRVFVLHTVVALLILLPLSVDKEVPKIPSFRPMNTTTFGDTSVYATYVPFIDGSVKSLYVNSVRQALVTLPVPGYLPPEMSNFILHHEAYHFQSFHYELLIVYFTSTLLLTFNAPFPYCFLLGGISTFGSRVVMYQHEFDADLWAVQTLNRDDGARLLLESVIAYEEDREMQLNMKLRQATIIEYVILLSGKYWALCFSTHPHPRERLKYIDERFSKISAC